MDGQAPASVGSDSRRDAASVCAELRLPDPFLRWLSGVARPDESAAPPLPSDDEADRLLQELGVEPADRVSTLAARPDPARDPALWWVLDRAYHDVTATIGIPPPWGGWPEFPEHTGPVGRHLYVWLCLAVLPQLRDYQQDLGIPPDISRVSLLTLGRELAQTRLLSGIAGVEASWMLPRTFRGTSYQLGRLVFDRAREGDTGRGILGPDETSLGTHIPSAGPLDPNACDESFAMAREFFARYFDEHPAAFNCHSWLMDDQLTAYLPATSNIIQFQRRFTYFNDSAPGDHEILAHVFGRRCR